MGQERRREKKLLQRSGREEMVCSGTGEELGLSEEKTLCVDGGGQGCADE